MLKWSFRLRTTQLSGGLDRAGDGAQSWLTPLEKRRTSRQRSAPYLALGEERKHRSNGSSCCSALHCDWGACELPPIRSERASDCSALLETGLWGFQEWQLIAEFAPNRSVRYRPIATRQLRAHVRRPELQSPIPKVVVRSALANRP